MVESAPKKRLVSSSSDRSEAKKPKVRPTIVGTKASQARANAIKTAQKTAAAAASGTKPQRKKSMNNEPPTLAKTYHTTASSLKQRPAWDLRGKVTDMTELYKLNLEKLEELRSFKRELDIIKEDKESQEKEAIQRAAALRTELQSLERQHISDIEELHTKQRIEHQKLEDDNLNYSRRLTTREIEVDDAKRKLETMLSELEHIKSENSRLKETLDKLSASFKEAESEKQSLSSKIQKTNMSISDHEKEIQTMKESIKDVNSTVQKLQSKLTEAHTVRDRLLDKVKALEETKRDAKSASRLSV
ncbi:hypothetical protein G6F43_007459 [Rhizopus delemar]|nr:hypothetical protein G6F43_007459 [Rhizopus delemar]